MKRHIWSCALAVGLLPGALLAQEAPGYASEGQARQIGFERHLYSPDLVMRFQAELDLSAEQQEAISEAVATLQRRALDLQWQMAAGMRALTDLVSPPQVNEREAVAAMERLLATEQGIKTAHLTMLVQIKNILTPEQQGTLDRMREQQASGWD